jgi:CheY-like chemotaxis protein
MTRVLFVDDEPALLRGFERGLTKLRSTWEAAFAPSGPAALAILATTPCDIVITDLSMPGMDGVELLTEVRARQPGVTRVVLSGHVSSVPPPIALAVVHQWFGKPRTTRQLAAAVEAALWARSLVADPALRDVLLGVPCAPTSELTTRHIADAVGEDLVRIVAADPGLTAKLLQTANASFFGDAQRVTSVHTAVTTIGVEGVRKIAAEVCDAAPMVPGFATHARQIAIVASEIVPPALCDDAYAAGLLHEIGRLVLAPEADPFLVARASGLLLATWQLPLEVARAVAYHLDPDASPVPDDPILAAVVRAKTLARN